MTFTVRQDDPTKDCGDPPRVAETLDEQIDLLQELVELMGDRYSDLRDSGTDQPVFCELVVELDELQRFYDDLAGHPHRWRALSNLRQLTRLARSADIRVAADLHGPPPVDLSPILAHALPLYVGAHRAEY